MAFNYWLMFRTIDARNFSKTTARKTKHFKIECDPFREEAVIEDPTTRVLALS